MTSGCTDPGMREYIGERINNYASFKYGDHKTTKGERTFSNFTENTAEKLLSEAGFEVKECGVTGDVREGRGDERCVNVIAISG